eukprot:1182391-Prorocentrum_minimum.AAC.3
MDVPHNEKRFAGYDKDSKELDSEVLQKYIMVRCRHIGPAALVCITHVPSPAIEGDLFFQRF